MAYGCSWSTFPHTNVPPLEKNPVWNPAVGQISWFIYPFFSRKSALWWGRWSSVLEGYSLLFRASTSVPWRTVSIESSVDLCSLSVEEIDILVVVWMRCNNLLKQCYSWHSLWRIENADCCDLSNPPVEVHRHLGMHEEQWREISQYCAQKLGLVTSANSTPHWGLVWNHDGFVHSCQCTPIVDQWARPYCLHLQHSKQLFRHYLMMLILSDIQEISRDVPEIFRDIYSIQRYPKSPVISGDDVALQ